MRSNPLHIALIYGSAREGRFCDVVAAWVKRTVQARGDFTIDAIDPKAPDSAGVGLRARLERADAFIVITPEYNHGYPAALKALIDTVSDEWQAKPVAFVSYGGLSGGLRAVEQLRLVFAELHAATIRDSVSFVNAWDQFDESGRLRDPARAERSMGRLLASLEWWAAVLRHGRRIAPYSQRAA